MFKVATITAATLAIGVVAAAGPAAGATQVSHAPVVAFQAAGNVGGGVLAAGTTFPPTTHGHATLKRGSDGIEVSINTSGLPPGAYTVWWIIFDSPHGCTDACNGDDLLNPDADVSVFWATGGIVHRSGDGNFLARHRAGDDLGEPGTQHILGDGSFDPSRAEIHNVIKYHGPASENPDTLHAQITTVQGSCLDGANAVDLGEPFGVQCFDPQAVAHPLPRRLTTGRM